MHRANTKEWIEKKEGLCFEMAETKPRLKSNRKYVASSVTQNCYPPTFSI